MNKSRNTKRCCVLAGLVFKKDGVVCADAAFLTLQILSHPCTKWRVRCEIGNHLERYVLISLISWPIFNGIFISTVEPFCVANMFGYYCPLKGGHLELPRRLHPPKFRKMFALNKWKMCENVLIKTEKDLVALIIYTFKRNVLHRFFCVKIIFHLFKVRVFSTLVVFMRQKSFWANKRKKTSVATWYRL